MPVRDMSDKDSTWTKKLQNDFRGSIATVGVNNGGKGGGKEEEGGIGKKKPVVAAATEAAAAPYGFDSLFEDGLGPGNEAELYDYLLYSARPQQDRPTKTDQHEDEHGSSNH